MSTSPVPTLAALARGGWFLSRAVPSYDRWVALGDGPVAHIGKLLLSPLNVRVQLLRVGDAQNDHRNQVDGGANQQGDTKGRRDNNAKGERDPDKPGDDQRLHGR